MSIFYMLVGLPASGKSKWAKENINEKTIWLSSDNLREELFGNINYQDKNNELFEEMNKRTRKLLKDGYNVIYDATNINSKRRMNLLRYLKKTGCKNICIYFSNNYRNCILNDNSRERKVGREVITKMYKNLQVPMYHEGWDDIHIFANNSCSNSNKLGELKIDNYNDYVENIMKNTTCLECIDMPQDNPYHTLSVSRHMYYVYSYIKNTKPSNKHLLIASMLHDIGKPFCKVFRENDKYAHYYGHENVSSQLAIELLKDNDFTDNQVIKIVTYIQLHMRLLNCDENGYRKLRDILNNNEVYEGLVLLRNADISSK